MTVQTLSTPINASEGSNKLLTSNGNSNGNIESSGDGLSFNATMNQTVSEYTADEQKYLLPDGQTLTAEELLEMLQSGNTLPGLNLPSIAELQQFKLNPGSAIPKMIAQFDTGIDSRSLQLDPSKYVVNDTFTMTQQQVMNNQLNQNQLIKLGAVTPDHILVSFNAVNTMSQHAPDSSVNGFSAAYGYQLANGVDGFSRNLSNAMGISTPVQHPQWNQSLGQSVQWMVNQNIQQAEIKLNPPDLGMLDIRVSITNDQATVHFSAANSAVREAIESAMPKLREMLEESGVTLADVNVSEHSLDNGKSEHDAEVTDSQNIEGVDDELVPTKNPSDNTMKLGLLDTYA